MKIAQALKEHQWSRHTIKEGSKGPIVADFAFIRVVGVRNELPGPENWLILQRDVFSGELKTYLSNAPFDVPQEILVRISGMHWPIETCFEEGKQRLGMGDYQVRGWLGWHHHTTLCILAHFFSYSESIAYCQTRSKKSSLVVPSSVVLKKDTPCSWTVR